MSLGNGKVVYDVREIYTLKAKSIALKVTPAQVVKKSVTFKNIPTQDYCTLTSRGDHIPPTYVMISC